MDDRDTSAEESSVKPGFDTIVEEHSDFVYNLALRMMGSPEDAEDVAQDAFISAYRAYDRFRGDSRVTTWLYRITTNAALMRLRKEKRARELTQTGLDNVEVASWEPTPERQALTSELGDKLMDGIDNLPPDLRAAVVLRDVEGAVQRGGRRRPRRDRLVVQVAAAPGARPAQEPPRRVLAGLEASPIREPTAASG